MTLPYSLPIRRDKAYGSRLQGSNADPFAVRIPYDLTGASAVVNSWNEETELQEITNASCAVTVISTSLGQVTWAAGIPDLANPGRFLLCYSITLQGGTVKHEGYFPYQIAPLPPF